MTPQIVDWVTSNFLPFEADLRRILRGVCASAAEVDDVVQEVYYKVLTMESVEHVLQPRAFLVQMARNVVLMRLRRESIVSIEAVACLDAFDIEDSSPTPERVAMARAELRWVLGLIANLPDRCKQVFQARRIDGLSQAETAASLGITEGIVEKETARGIKLISRMIAAVGIQDEQNDTQHAGRADRKNHVKN